MKSSDPKSQEDSSIRRFHQGNSTTTTQQPRDTTMTPFMHKTISKNPNNNNSSSSGAAGRSLQGFGINDLVSSVVPPITVVLEGRSICQRISLEKHGSYQSLALALRQMFVDEADDDSMDDLDLSNAIPGHLIAYEDMENDLLLAGDLTWKDFVRVAKRIRILPVRGNNTRRV